MIYVKIRKHFKVRAEEKALFKGGLGRQVVVWPLKVVSAQFEMIVIDHCKI